LLHEQSSSDQGRGNALVTRFAAPVPRGSDAAARSLVLPGNADALVEALGKIARAVSETLELKDVFARVADAASVILPFDGMAVLRAEGGVMTLYSLVPHRGDPKPPKAMVLEDFSPAIRPRPGHTLRIDDVPSVLDPGFSVDHHFAEDGVRSLLFVPLQRADQWSGIVGVTSLRPRAFTAEHERSLGAVANLVSLALEHERLWGLDAKRRGRLDAVDALLPLLANVLDVREIFNQISAVVKPVLPHDRLMLSSVNDDHTEISIDALSGEPVPPELLGPMQVSQDEVAQYNSSDFQIIRDTAEGPGAETEKCRKGRALGIRSLLKIPLRLEGGVIGGIAFLSGTPLQYSEEDVVVARRVADHVSLALSHQRLAEEERRAGEARERAARLEQRVEALKEELATSRGYGRVVGESRIWADVLKQATQVAPTETTVLLTGESGTGKEVVARFIHRGSPRAKGPFVALNCAALPETLLESELFGHERGAFTGAVASRAGSIEQAAGGVLFLDEVGELSPQVQAKFLRVLQEREFKRVGGNRAIRADVRVVAATNRDLKEAMARGEFREDLFYRLNVFAIGLPALRRRLEDVLPLAEAFLEELGSRGGRPAAGISKAAREILMAYSWPGNVRELRNVLERATILCDGGLIAAEHLPIEIAGREEASREASGAEAFPAGGVDLQVVERDLIVKALRTSKNNRARAARLLGLTRAQLYRRLQKHRLESLPSAPIN
jgi:transcriptional regulator with GAF, ATPase, and Fis domain